MRDKLQGKVVVVYIRVSSKDQKDFGNSLAVQLKRVKEFCALYGMEVIFVFEEDYSAKNFERPEFKKLKEYVKANKNRVDYILVQKWDRFSRNVGKALLMIEYFKKMNVEVNSIENWINYSDPDHIVMLSIYLSTPEAENSKISERTKAGTIEALENGRYCLSHPKGYMSGIGADGKPLMQPDPKTAPLVTQLLKDYATGLYQQQDLIKKYRAKGLDLKKSALSRMLDNPLYMGMVNVPAYKDRPRHLVEGKHQALISKDLFYVIQSLKHGKRSGKKRRGRDEHFPLTTFLKCAECGETIYGSRSNNGRSKKNTRYYHYYQCNSKCKCKRYRVEQVHEELYSVFESIKPSEEVLELFQQILIDEYQKTKQERQKDENDLEKKIYEVESRQLQLTEKYGLSKINDDMYAKLMKNYNAEIMDLKAAKAQLGDYQKDLDKFLSFGMTLLTNLDVFYKNAGLKVKVQLVGSIFDKKLEFFKNSFRTLPFNEAVLLLCKYNKAFQSFLTKKESIRKDDSLFVPWVGIEPTLQRNTSLSRARLPIPPPRQSVVQTY